MATTRTASLALSTFTPSRAHIGTHVLCGTYNGAGLSASSSGLLLLAKIPPDCTVHVVETHSTGASTQVLNIGIKHQNASTIASMTVSALGSIYGGGTAAVTNIHGPYTCTRETTSNEQFKYVIASLQSGTVTSSMSMKYQVFYSIGDAQG